MKTIIGGVNYNKAYNILKRLEDFQMIKIIKQKMFLHLNINLSMEYTLPYEVAKEVQAYILKSRSEWHEQHFLKLKNL